MFLFVEICIVVASLAVVVIAVVTARTMVRIGNATDQVSKLAVEIKQLVGPAKELVLEARETVTSVAGVVAPIRRVVERFEPLGERTADLSASVLAEVEPALHMAVATVRGVRSASAFFLKRLLRRFIEPRPALRTELAGSPLSVRSSGARTTPGNGSE